MSAKLLKTLGKATEAFLERCLPVMVGDWVDLVDIKATIWSIRGQLVCPTGSNVADMFSAAV